MDKVLEEDYASPELGEACLERELWAPTVCKVQGALRLYTRPQNQRICHETKQSPQSTLQHQLSTPKSSREKRVSPPHHSTQQLPG